MHKNREGEEMNLYKFFDHFGMIIWLFLIIDSLVYFNSGIVDYRVWLRLIFGVGGLLVDGYLVFFYKEGRRGKRKK